MRNAWLLEILPLTLFTFESFLFVVVVAVSKAIRCVCVCVFERPAEVYRWHQSKCGDGDSHGSCVTVPLPSEDSVLRCTHTHILSHSHSLQGLGTRVQVVVVVVVARAVYTMPVAYSLQYFNTTKQQ